MTLEVVLFLLRLLSAIVLLGFVTMLFLVLWRDYRNTAAQAEFTQQTYGYLEVMQLSGEDYLPTEEIYPLLSSTSIGRAPTNSITLPQDPFASADHAVLMLRNGVWWLEDRQSRNGTRLNGIEVEQPVIVTDSDIIHIGTKHFRLNLE